MPTRLDCHWVEYGSSAQTELERQGYVAGDYRLAKRREFSEPKGQRYYVVNRCKEVSS